MKILLLGHNGLLGNMVFKYFKSKTYDIITTDLRWPNEDFKKFILENKVDFIINCIGIIPQKKPKNELYELVNNKLPIWLDNLNINIIHPDTDEPADTPYGIAKDNARKNIGKNTKIIKTSIIGFEKSTNFSFLEWFLNSEGKVNGYTNQYWNGITTFEWAKYAEKMILNWDIFNNVTVLSNPECQSKYNILLLLKKIFNKDIEIISTESTISKNNCMNGELTKKLEDQLIEMKVFYER
jgi:dTDP-4-dehydrorhamnose reductase